MAKDKLAPPSSPSWLSDDPLHPNSGEGWQRRRSDAFQTHCDASRIPAEKPNNQVMTEQAHKDSADINFIMAKYEKNGILPRTKEGQPFFGDFSNVPEPMQAYQAIVDAEQAFDQLHAKVKARFGNDPMQMIEFLREEKNLEESYQLGLRDRPAPPPAPMKVEVVNPAPPLKKD